jgi:glycosyltransferase involved in cell wall biosynthesis
MKVHICLITSARLFEIQYGGEGRFTRSLGRWLVSREYYVTLIGSSFAGVKAKELTFDTYKAEHRLHSSKGKPKVLYPPFFVYVASRLVISFQALIKILRIHRGYKIAIIHAQDTGYSGLAAILSGKILRVPVVISSHGIRHLTIASQNKGAFNRMLIKLEYKLDKFCVRNADGLIVVNPFIGKYYQDRVPQSFSKIQFIPIPIKISTFEFNSQHRTEIRNELRISADSIVVGFIGRLVGVKNLISLLSASSEVLDKFPTMYLLLVGTGIQEQNLKNLVISKGLQDKVIFTGSRADVNKILSALDIFVLPSFTEGLSTSLLEAMASGRAVICSDIPANTQLVNDGENGIIVNPNKHEEIREALVLLATSNELRTRLGQAAIETARKYDEDNIFPLVEKYYRSLIAT